MRYLTGSAVTRLLSDVQPQTYSLEGHWQRLLAEAQSVRQFRKATDGYHEAIKLTASRLEGDIASHLCRHEIASRFQRNIDRALVRMGFAPVSGMGEAVVESRLGEISTACRGSCTSLVNDRRSTENAR